MPPTMLLTRLRKYTEAITPVWGTLAHACSRSASDFVGRNPEQPN